MSSLNGIAEEYRMPVIFSTHPRSMRQIESRNSDFTAGENFEPFDFRITASCR
jgi:UDP-N-acetylglucosamine 2-epimerase (non-hydrolysing)